MDLAGDVLRVPPGSGSAGFAGGTDSLDAGRIRRLALENPFDGAPVFYIGATESTMDDIRLLRGGGAPYGAVVTADYQSAGRGRGGAKVWDAPAGTNLLFSLSLGPNQLPSPPESIALRLALGVSRLLEIGFGLRPTIKWPNDVLVGGLKICGILCEAKGKEAFVGIGLNCNQRGFPETLANRATSVSMQTGRAVVVHKTLEALLPELAHSLREERWQEGVRKRLPLKPSADVSSVFPPSQ